MKKHILINNYLSGTITIPDHYGKIPTILFLHGFGTDKNEVGNTFSIASEKLCEQGIGSLRIDFSGFGESKGETTDTTIEKLISDADIAFDFLLTQHFIDTQRVGLCGFSLGAGISALITHKRGNEIKSMALLSPAGDLPNDFSEYFGFDQFNRLEKSENEMELDLGWRRIKLKNKFIESLKNHSLMDAISSYEGAFLVIAGENDFSCKHAYNYVKKVSSSNKKAVIIDDNDHIFNSANNETSSIDQVTTEVTTWFKKTL